MTEQTAQWVITAVLVGFVIQALTIYSVVHLFVHGKGWLQRGRRDNVSDLFRTVDRQSSATGERS